MAPYRLHGFKQSGNTYKVALFLNSAGLDWEPVAVDFFGGETRTPEWRARVNEMGECPVLETGDRKLTQSGAILTWLSETTGKFAPQTPEERYDVQRWILYDNYRFTNYFATRRFLKCFAPEAPHQSVFDFLKGRADAAFAVVDKHLASSPYMVGQAPTIADLSLIGYMYFPVEETGYDLSKSHPNIYAWAERMKTLPGWKHPYDMFPGKILTPLR